MASWIPEPGAVIRVTPEENRALRIGSGIGSQLGQGLAGQGMFSGASQAALAIQDQQRSSLFCRQTLDALYLPTLREDKPLTFEQELQEELDEWLD